MGRTNPEDDMYGLVTGFVAVVFNVVADFAYAALDPRIRLN